jgi:NAD(P)-dependent dehydrogenase (short-subunit alcohol dehydrogenase family)
MQLFNLEDDIGVVTGALGKLGPIWVETLLEAGARVLALDRPGTPEAPAFQDLQARFGPERLALAFADVCRRPELEAALDRCGRLFGTPPTILVNNAGIDAPPAPGGKAHRLEEIPLAANLRILSERGRLFSSPRCSAAPWRRRTGARSSTSARCTPAFHPMPGSTTTSRAIPPSSNPRPTALPRQPCST